MTAARGHPADRQPPDDQQQESLALDDEVVAFYQAHAAGLHGYLCRMGADPATAEEVAQDSVLVARRKWTQLRDGNPRAYLYKVATRRLRSVLKRRSNEIPHPHQTLPDQPTAEDLEARATAGVQAETFLRQLPRRQREVVVLRMLCDLSEAETAEALQISVGSVKNYLSVGMRRLRELAESAITLREEVRR